MIFITKGRTSQRTISSVSGNSSTADARVLMSLLLLWLHWNSLEDDLPDCLLLLPALHDVEVRVLLQLRVELGDEVTLEALLPLLTDVDVDVGVASEHGLTPRKHHHRAYREVFELILAEQTFGGEDEQNSQATVDLKIMQITNNIS